MPAASKRLLLGRLSNLQAAEASSTVACNRLQPLQTKRSAAAPVTAYKALQRPPTPLITYNRSNPCNAFCA